MPFKASRVTHGCCQNGAHEPASRIVRTSTEESRVGAQVHKQTTADTRGQPQRWSRRRGVGLLGPGTNQFVHRLERRRKQRVSRQSPTRPRDANVEQPIVWRKEPVVLFGRCGTQRFGTAGEEGGENKSVCWVWFEHTRLQRLECAVRVASSPALKKIDKIASCGACGPHTRARRSRWQWPPPPWRSYHPFPRRCRNWLRPRRVSITTPTSAA